MPIYEFKCKKCGNIYESLCFHSNGDDKGPCPACGGSDSEKQLSVFSSGGSGSGLDLGAAPSSGACASRGGFS